MWKTVTSYLFHLSEYPELIVQMDNKSAEMAAQGKTDNIPVKEPVVNPETDPMVIYRSWVNGEAASEWKNYVESIIPADPEKFPYTLNIIEV